jgi:hypothetical protein
MLISYIEQAQHTHSVTLVSVGECAERGLICSGIVYFPATHTVKCGGLCAWCRYKIVAPVSFIDRHKTIQLSTLDEGRQLFCVICQKFPTVTPTSISCGACALLHAFECDYIVFCGWVLRGLLGADVGRVIAAEMLYFFAVCPRPK